MAELASSFLLDYESLDRDHQQLNEMLNEIVQAIDGDEAGKCRDLVPEFVKFAKKHFSREEALLVKIGYPNAKKHHDHHKSLDVQMNHMLEFAKAAEDNAMAREKLRKEMVFFLMDDVITTDMDFKKFIKAKAGAKKA